jgi:hypothetical protein
MPVYLVTMTQTAVKQAVFEDNDKSWNFQLAAINHPEVMLLTSEATLAERMIFFVVKAPTLQDIRDYMEQIDLDNIKNLQIREVTFDYESGRITQTVY